MTAAMADDQLVDLDHEQLLGAALFAGLVDELGDPTAVSLSSDFGWFAAPPSQPTPASDCPGRAPADMVCECLQ